MSKTLPCETLLGSIESIVTNYKTTNIMNDKLLTQAMALFDTPEKWEAFCELVNQKDRIVEIWCDNVRDSIIGCYNRESIPNKYKFILEKERGYMLNFYLLQKRDIIRMQLQLNNFKAIVWINPTILNKKKVLEKHSAIDEIFSTNHFEQSSHDWEPFCSRFPNDIVVENNWENCVYHWGHNVEEVANKIYNYYIKPMLREESINLMSDIITTCTL